jgi:hypothetical protein
MVRDAAGRVLGLERREELGRVVVIGTFAGLAYEAGRDADFEAWVSELAAPLRPAAEVEAPETVLWRSGVAGSSRLVFLINGDESAPAEVRVRFSMSPVIGMPSR